MYLLKINSLNLGLTFCNVTKSHLDSENQIQLRILYQSQPSAVEVFHWGL